MLSEQRIDVVLFEISDGPLRGQNRVPLDVFRGVTAHGYQIFRDRDSDPVDPEDESHRLLGRDAYLHNYFASVKDLRDLTVTADPGRAASPKKVARRRATPTR